MAIIATSVFQPTPGKIPLAQSLLREADEILESFGAKGQVYQLVRGGVPFSLALVTEYENSKAYGAALDKTYADPGFQNFMERAQETEALIPVRTADFAEIPGMEVQFDDLPTGAMMVTMFHIREGKIEQSLERIQRSKTLMEKHGAKVRAIRSMASDPWGLTAVAGYYNSLEHWGEVGGRLQADPEWQSYAAEITGNDASSDFLRTTLYRNV